MMTMTRTEAEALTLEIVQASLRKAEAENARDLAIAKVEEEFLGKIDECTVSIAEKTEKLRAWAEASPDEFPKGKKSIEFSCGTIGFRDHPAKVEKLKKISWENIVASMRAHKILKAFLRRPQLEVNKEAILAQRKELGLEVLREVGILIKQDTTFFVEPNAEDSDLDVKVPA